MFEHETRAKLDAILDELAEIRKDIAAMSASTTNSFANLQAAVAADTTVDQSALTLITGLVAQIAAASPTGDNPAIDALVTQLQANAASISAAVAQNTPAAPAAAAARP